MEASRRLREAIHHTLQQTDNDLKAQQTNSDYALRKRMHEMKRAIEELNWQKAQVTKRLGITSVILVEQNRIEK